MIDETTPANSALTGPELGVIELGPLYHCINALSSLSSSSEFVKTFEFLTAYPEHTRKMLLSFAMPCANLVEL